MNKHLLDIKGLKTYFFTSKGTVKAVDGVDFKINEKETVGLVGESGCGKSTTATSIMRLVPNPPGRIIEGEILFKGKDLLRLEEEHMRHIRGKDISMVFQHPLTYLNPIMKVGEQIAEAIVLHQGLGKEEAKIQAIEALKMVQVPESTRIAEQYPFQLSGGMRQRVLIAAAISCNPSLLIADEPTSALDVTVQAQVLELINGLTDRLGTSLLLITHDLGIVADVCDRVYVMYGGKVMEYGDVFTVYEEPKHPYTEGLMQSVLSIDRFVEKFATLDGVVPDLVNPPSGCRFHPRCSKRMGRCNKEMPQLIEIEQGHGVACWLWS